MSHTYLAGFIVVSSLLYAFNKPEQGDDLFSKSKVKTAKVGDELSKKHISLGNYRSAAPKSRAVTLFDKLPKTQYEKKQEQSIIKRASKAEHFVPFIPTPRPPRKYIESSQNIRDNLIVNIKSELFRLGCYKGKVNTRWGRDVVERISTLNRGLASSEPTQATLNYLQKQETVGCAGNKVWDQLVFAGGKNYQALKKINSDELATADVNFADRPLSEPKNTISKRKADKKIASFVLKKAVKKRRKPRRRAARKKFGFNGLFGLEG